MAKILAIPIFIVALFTLLFQSYVEHIIHGVVLDQSGQVINESPIDEQTKSSFLSTLAFSDVFGLISFLSGVLILVKAYFQ